MKKLNVIKQLNASEFSFPIDWEEIDENKFMEVIHHQKSHLISNLSDGVAQFLKSPSNEVHKNIEELILANNMDAIWLAEKAGFSTHLSVRFFPQTEKIEKIAQDDVVPYSNCHISDETKTNLKLLSKDLPVDEFFEIKLELDKANLYLYQEKSSLAEEINAIKKKTVTASIAASVLIASTVFVGFFASSGMKSDIAKIFHKKSSVALSIKKVNDYSSKLSLSFDSLNEDLTDSIINKYVPTLKDLSSADINQAISYVNQKGSHGLSLKNSEEVSFDEKVENIVSIISDVYGKKPNDNVRLIASAVAKETESHHLDYKMMLSIIKVESSFDQSMVSSTGDLSVAQVNYEHWAPEFKRLGYPKLDKEKLKTDIGYSVKIMADILEIMSHRHKKDKLWYARYHSGTPSKKIAYAQKVSNELNLIEENEILNSKEKINSLIAELTRLKNSNDVSMDKVDEVIVNLTYLGSLIDWKMKEEIKHKMFIKNELLASNGKNSSI